MEYSKIIAITGLPGLFELITSKSDGGIVRSLEDKNTRFVSSRVHQFSHLESIEVYTTRQNENLVTVLKAMETSTEKLPDEKDPKSLKAYFEKVFPELDHSRVYASDLKKMIKWFLVLRDNKVEIKLSEPVADEIDEEAAEEPKPVKKAAKEKAEDKEADTKKPAKKAAEKESEMKTPVKKAPAAKEEAPAKATKKNPVKKATASKDEKKSSPQDKGKKPAAKKKSK